MLSFASLLSWNSCQNSSASVTGLQLYRWYSAAENDRSCSQQGSSRIPVPALLIPDSWFWSLVSLLLLWRYLRRKAVLTGNLFLCPGGSSGRCHLKNCDHDCASGDAVLFLFPRPSGCHLGHSCQRLGTFLSLFLWKCLSPVVQWPN